MKKLLTLLSLALALAAGPATADDPHEPSAAELASERQRQAIRAEELHRLKVKKLEQEVRKLELENRKREEELRDSY